MKLGEKTSTYCRLCLKDTEHSSVAVANQDRIEEFENNDLDHSINIAVLQCKECFTYQLRVGTWTEPTEWSSEEFVPPHPDRRLPRWGLILPPEAYDLLKEVYVALAQRQLWLVGLGVRTLIDMFIVSRVGDQGTFRKGVVRLKDEGFLGFVEIGVLQQALNLGDATTHRQRKPTLSECIAALEITEGLLHKLTLGESAALLSAGLAGSARPPRKRTSPNKGGA